MSSLQERLKKLRLKSNKSVQSIANCCGVTRQAVYKWENGQSTPDVNHLVKLVELFDSSAEYIVLGQETIDNSNSKAILNDLLNKLNNATQYSQLVKSISEYLNRCRLDKFFYMQKFRGDISPEPYVFAITDLPMVWLNEYRNKKYASIDPTWEYCFNNVNPILGDKLFIPLSKTNCPITKDFINGMETYVPSCVLVPVHGGCCLSAFVVSSKTNNSEDKQLLARYTDSITLIGHHLHSAVHRLQEQENTHHHSVLSEKELAAIALLAEGKNIEQIANKLHITKAAVSARIDRAKIKLNANNREQLVLYAASRNILPHNLSGIQTDKPSQYQYRILDII